VTGDSCAQSDKFASPLNFPSKKFLFHSIGGKDKLPEFIKLQTIFFFFEIWDENEFLALLSLHVSLQ